MQVARARRAGWMPSEWRAGVVDGEIVLRVPMTTDPPRIEATANGRTVPCEATAEEPPGCD